MPGREHELGLSRESRTDFPAKLAYIWLFHFSAKPAIQQDYDARDYRHKTN